MLASKDELQAALDFLVRSVKSHNADYHHHTDENALQRCEALLREAILELTKTGEGKGKRSRSFRWRRGAK